MHDIKIEPLGDSDIEICVDEPKIEYRSFVSDSDDSLPELERMDVPPLNIKINDIFSVDDKREVFNTVVNQLGTDDPNLNVEEVKTCRRYVN